MKLYIYEHCPFCTRARLALGLKKLSYETVVVMEGDSETPARLIGKKAVPILQKRDGSHMGESLDIVHYVDHLGTPIFDGPADEAVEQWIRQVWSLCLKLCIPRFVKGEFAELATPQAREAYRLREIDAFGNLEQLLIDTPTYVADMNIQLERLGVIMGATEIAGMTDIKLWPVLRSISIVKDLTFPEAVRRYMLRLEKESGVPLLFDQAT